MVAISTKLVFLPIKSTGPRVLGSSPKDSPLSHAPSDIISYPVNSEFDGYDGKLFILWSPNFPFLNHRSGAVSLLSPVKQFPRALANSPILEVETPLSKATSCDDCLFGC